LVCNFSCEVSPAIACPPKNISSKKMYCVCLLIIIISNSFFFFFFFHFCVFAGIFAGIKEREKKKVGLLLPQRRYILYHQEILEKRNAPDFICIHKNLSSKAKAKNPVKYNKRIYLQPNTIYTCNTQMSKSWVILSKRTLEKLNKTQSKNKLSRS
jgi:hypothetical protein